jgi:hypothetical protein
MKSPSSIKNGRFNTSKFTAKLKKIGLFYPPPPPPQEAQALATYKGLFFLN